jgi:hypothetical protein
LKILGVFFEKQIREISGSSEFALSEDEGNDAGRATRPTNLDEETANEVGGIL